MREYRFWYDAVTSARWSRWYLCDGLQGAIRAFRSEWPKVFQPRILCVQVRRPGPVAHVWHLARSIRGAVARLCDKVGLDVPFLLLGAWAATMGIISVAMRLHLEWF